MLLFNLKMKKQSALHTFFFHNVSNAAALTLTFPSMCVFSRVVQKNLSLYEAVSDWRI